MLVSVEENGSVSFQPIYDDKSSAALRRLSSDWTCGRSSLGTWKSAGRK